jgi:monoamine oxidase
MADEFGEALGGFCWTFSILESEVRDALYHTARLPRKIGNAILSGARAKDSLDLLTRLSDVLDWSKEQKSELVEIKTQFGLINDLRNDILHHGAYRLGREYIVSNRKVAHIDTRLRELRISAKTLTDASADLWQIVTRLQLLTRPHFPPEVLTSMRNSLASSWQYKQPPQAWSGNTSPDTPPKPPRQRKPSPRSRRDPEPRG